MMKIPFSRSASLSFNHLLGVGLLLCFSPVAMACSCIDQKMPMNEILAKSDLVFTGTVTQKTKDKLINGEYYNVEFQLAESYKGASKTDVTIKTGTQTAMCGFPFEEGETYLVFANKFSDADQKQEPEVHYGTGLCSKTKAIKYAAADLQELKKLK